MEIFNLILMILAAVLVSSLLDRVIKPVSAPLIQIALGIILAVTLGTSIETQLDPELFLVLFIAPLLFNEANHIDKLRFWQNKGMILSLALGLVVASTLIVGFVVHAIAPSIPLAVAFALGAALGPTDAVAVSSMSGVAKLSDKQKAVLGGESLINDASGLVSFQFAIAAAVTGTFSVLDAGEEFCVDFFGGIVLGLIVGAIIRVALDFIHDKGIGSRTFAVLFEVAIPFGVFLLGEHVGTSGILAVVACGVVLSVTRSSSDVETAKTNILSAGVWDVVTFALNGCVFVLLGMMLPGGIFHELEDEVMSLNFDLIFIALVVTAVVILMRFLWTVVVEKVFGGADVSRNLLKHSAILAFAGAKGAITLSIALTIPYVIASRSAIIFIASTVIIFTLLLANFIVPVLAPADKESEEARREKELKCYMRVLRGTVARLVEESEDADSDSDRLAYKAVIDDYGQHIEDIRGELGISESESDRTDALRLDIISWQRKMAKDMFEQGEISKGMLSDFEDRLDDAEEKLEKGKKLAFSMHRCARHAKSYMRNMLKTIGIKTPSRYKSSEAYKYRRMNNEINARTLEMLQVYEYGEEAVHAPETIAKLMSEYQRFALMDQTVGISVTQIIKSKSKSENIRARALHYEESLVDDEYEAGRIERGSLNKIRRLIAAQQLDISGDL